MQCMLVYNSLSLIFPKQKRTPWGPRFLCFDTKLKLCNQKAPCNNMPSQASTNKDSHPLDKNTESQDIGPPKSNTPEKAWKHKGKAKKTKKTKFQDFWQWVPTPSPMEVLDFWFFWFFCFSLVFSWFFSQSWHCPHPSLSPCKARS